MTRTIRLLWFALKGQYNRLSEVRQLALLQVWTLIVCLPFVSFLIPLVNNHTRPILGGAILVCTTILIVPYFIIFLSLVLFIFTRSHHGHNLYIPILLSYLNIAIVLLTLHLFPSEVSLTIAPFFFYVIYASNLLYLVSLFFHSQPLKTLKLLTPIKPFQPSIAPKPKTVLDPVHELAGLTEKQLTVISAPEHNAAYHATCLLLKRGRISYHEAVSRLAHLSEKASPNSK